MQPINKIAKIDITSKKKQFSQQNFRQVLKQVAENIVKEIGPTDSISELQDKINYYGSNGKVTYYDLNMRQNNFYS